MSTPTEPSGESTSPQQPRRSRIGRRRGLWIGAGVLVLLVVVGVAAAWLAPGRGHPRGPFAGPDGPPPRPVELLEYVEHAGPRWDGPDWGPPGRGRWDRGPRARGWRAGDGVLAGTVRSVSPDSITVAVDGGGERTVRAGSRTRVIGDTDTELADLQPGERIVVAVEGTGSDATARTIWSPRARVTGTVTALDGGRATVMGFDGIAVTVDVSRLSEPPAVGDVVTLTGTPADGGVRADAVRELPKAS